MLNNITEEPWAAKMLDSSGHLPSGMLSSTITDLGDFDQCIKIDESIDNDIRIEGKYCLLTVKPPPSSYDTNDNFLKSNQSNWIIKEINDWLEVNKHFTFSNAICFPSECDPNHIQFLLGQNFPILRNFNYQVDFCQTSKDSDESYGTETIIALTIIKISLALVLIGSLIDMSTNRDSTLLAIIKCFSLTKNIKILFRISAEKSKSEYRLQFIHGLRVLGTLWVILAHSSGFILVTFLLQVSPFARYPDDAIENSKSVLSQYILNASLAVQIFFIMSGCLTVYSTLSKKKLEISFIQFVLLRWLRFTPPLIGMMCLTICMQILGSGPLFQKDLVKPFVSPCYDNWWAHILYIVNWFDLRQMCGIQSWYLGADFQLHIICFVVIYFFYKNQYISYYFSYSMIILGAAIPALLVAVGVGGIPRVDVIFKPKYDIPGKETTIFFFGTHIHLISYFLGTILGFALLNRKFISISKALNRLIWCMVVIFTILIPLATYPVLQEDIHPLNYDISNAIIFGFVLIIWSLCMVWIIYNCAINRAIVLSKILSANFLHPLSRLSFCVYLTHLMTIWFNVQQIRHPISINAITMGQYFCTVVVETFVLGLFLYLTFEAPFVNLIKLIFMGRKRQNTTNEDDHNNSIDSQNSASYNLKNINNNF